MSETGEKGDGLPVRHVQVAAGIIWRGDEVLCCQRPAGRPQAGFWEFPGGKLRPGESAAEALARELREELSLTVKDCHFWCTKEHGYPEIGLAVTLHFFHVTAFSGEPRAREGQSFRWLRPEEARKLNFLPADRELADRLKRP